MAGAFDADKPFSLDADMIRISATSLFDRLKPLVGERSPSKNLAVQAEQIHSPKYQTGSSQYASATSEAGSDGSAEPKRMSLGPSGAAML
ncbi:hypothetical protein PHMEG_0004921 [Phytophthora megakarya]|uniref:Uncharacterized protein n=1 Tax=Phytophthora megakarya TaxID=4795 RepID=A0A225WU83_9STRA|nr:hypothetical protein PHMEG_0004921 [Phytophthora megakarya]